MKITNEEIEQEILTARLEGDRYAGRYVRSMVERIEKKHNYVEGDEDDALYSQVAKAHIYRDIVADLIGEQP